MINLKKLVHNYMKNNRQTRDELKEKCYGIKDFNKLLIIAEIYFNRHWWSYYRWHKDSLPKLKKVVYENEEKLKTCKSFDDFLIMLYKLIDETELKNSVLGATLLYDIALVFGMSIGSLPTKVYANNRDKTQATAKVILGKDYNIKKQKFKKHIIFNVEDFPADMQVLEAYEIEDFLCIYHGSICNTNELVRK